MTAVGPLLLPALVACAAYTAAAARLRRRGDGWPWWRDACCWLAGTVFVAGAAVPWQTWLPPFTAHMAAHLAAGMLAPLPAVLARPVTLALRALPVPGRRALLAVLRSRPAAVLAFPPVAAALDIGGLWLLYRAPVPPQWHHSPWLYVHLFAAGWLFTFAVLAVDPLRHRAGLALRAVTLLAAAAAHAVLAKTLWAAGPPGTGYAPADLRLASRVMYYGGDVAEIALAVAVAAQWYGARGRALARRARRRGVGGVAGVLVSRAAGPEHRSPPAAHDPPHEQEAAR
jgi:putative membrane protein